LAQERLHKSSIVAIFAAIPDKKGKRYFNLKSDVILLVLAASLFKDKYIS
jgi:hypothetical protein